MADSDERISHHEPHSRGLSTRLNWLRAGVLGANDGIVSVAAIIVGSQKLMPYTPVTMQNRITVNSHIAGMANSSRSGVSRLRRASPSRRARSSCFSPSVSHFASSMRLSRKASTTKPSTSAGTASRMNIHCQSARPFTPPKDSMMAPDSGAPNTNANGCATSSSAITRLCRCAGYQ